ncbi:uncharacterized protein K452DRAFT_102144 [Aplosporella prunicola CBS 121167]|uniref:Uncharacterized protein n=1 Tax=Aplosporella prunicola CBS 121167 TaxID=1176127 RepID=A0A6A6B0J0_9PEZI|nr:uncharacterized protein K452DRAFT_102144 [Aplosporella prunicola CBS 121167]KAF2137540.1 hypothetical protein K452DRAFT_102144 [Aplosporella prunicola CBS 121167]
MTRALSRTSTPRSDLASSGSAPLLYTGSGGSLRFSFFSTPPPHFLPVGQASLARSAGEARGVGRGCVSSEAVVAVLAMYVWRLASGVDQCRDRAAATRHGGDDLLSASLNFLGPLAHTCWRSSSPYSDVPSFFICAYQISFLSCFLSCNVYPINDDQQNKESSAFPFFFTLFLFDYF